jgi:multidrug efflux system membrane fusion protein
MAIDTEVPIKKRGAGPYIFLTAIAVTVLVVLAVAFVKRHRVAQAGGGAPGAGRGAMTSLAVPIVPGVVEQKDVPIFLDGLGTVQAFNTVTVRSRVDGEVRRIAFVEGQDVRQGDLLAQIDPAPYQAQLDQNIARKAQDEAQLAVAKLTLSRDAQLLASRILAQQDYDTQQAQVDQLVATVKGDQAAIDSARVNLAYTTITSPLDGRTGIRQVDQGNIIHETDSNGIVVITQLRPISVVFTLPEQNLPEIQRHLSAGETLSVFAVARDDRTALGEGKLAVIDNQIDISTGTIRLKATFPNDNFRLWPGQFVNVRLLLTTITNGLVVPASVVQRGPDGAFAFVINSDLTAQVRPIKVAQIEQNQALIDSGLTPGERVVVDGQYKLQPGAKVKLPEQTPKAAKSQQKSKPSIPSKPES